MNNKKTIGQKSINRGQLITIGDLEEFKNLLFEEMRLQYKNLLAEINKQQSQVTKQWLRSNEVCKILGISVGTLQNLRNNRTIAYSKVGGVAFYKFEDLAVLMEAKKIARQSNGKV
ncbi:helix-turn-helix domain-containing protein [Pseudochryseolinea flava]|uniref:DNA-binding protein n=1 Tax=Pseudochryseolinea flava TaxID=2059302 RepID=A0A364XTA1_9BACT|nr:helix-turn-helix domain-containing protein [Pseudochryseolinea flava]RAV97593.1 DNA-binding protein [Pseudochryseolinea flava]